MGLPGDIIKLREHHDYHGEICDGYNCECTDTVTHRIQGETDSFGAEYLYFCPKCKDKCVASIEECKKEEHSCAWCKEVTTLSPIRDWEEGLNGPVYEVCSSCISKQNREMMEEYDEFLNE